MIQQDRSQWKSFIVLKAGTQSSGSNLETYPCICDCLLSLNSTPSLLALYITYSLASFILLHLIFARLLASYFNSALFAIQYSHHLFTPLGDFQLVSDPNPSFWFNHLREILFVWLYSFVASIICLCTNLLSWHHTTSLASSPY